MASRSHGKTNLLGKNNLKNFGILTRKYIGAPFAEYNCLQFVHDFYTDAGIEVPDKYKEYSLETYMKDWEKDPDGMIRVMVELFETIGEEADVKSLKKGDLIVVQYKSSTKFPALYIGANKALAASREAGVQTYILGDVFVPVMARRLRCQQ